jgi:hypothetical protein
LATCAYGWPALPPNPYEHLRQHVCLESLKDGLAVHDARSEHALVSFGSPCLKLPCLARPASPGLTLPRLASPHPAPRRHVAPACCRYFKGMIAPLRPMRLAGVVWYQGEENDHPEDACPGPAWYKCLFPAMISYWRKEFKSPDLPFFYVLLAAGHTAMMREAQAQGAGAIARTAFASALDLGAKGNEFLVPGHPPRKQGEQSRPGYLHRSPVLQCTHHTISTTHPRAPSIPGSLHCCPPHSTQRNPQPLPLAVSSH